MYHTRKIQENLKVKACTENHELSTGLYYGSFPRSVCTGKVRQNTVQLWLDSSTRHNGKDTVCNQQLVQTNLACVSQGNGQPLVPLLPASVSYREQQSNVGHYNHNFQNSFRDKGNTNSTSLVESKHLEKEWVWYLQGSERNMNINLNKRFAESKSETNRKWKKYFQGQENVCPNQLSSQDIQCINLLKAYDSMTSDSPSCSLSQGGFANKSQSLKSGQSNSPHSKFKSSQTSSSLHCSMLSLDDSLYKARPISNKSADIHVTQNPLTYLNLRLGNQREEHSVNMYPDKCKAQGISKIPVYGSLLHNGSLLNDSHPLLHVCEQHLNTKNLTCICSIHENADRGVINSESDVCKDDCRRTSHFIISGRKTLKMSGTLTLPNKDMNNPHDSHYAVCQKSAGILCHLPTKSDCTTEMETNQRVPEDREKSGTEDMFSNAVEIREELSGKSPDNFLGSSLKNQVKPHFPVIMNNNYATQHRATNDLLILEAAQTPVYESLPPTSLQSNSSQGNFYRNTQKEISNLESTEVGKRAMGNSQISGYFRNSTPSGGEENNKGENDLNMKQKDNSTLYNREHDPILKEFLKGNVETKQLLQTFPLMDSNMLKIMKLGGYSLNDRTKTPMESYLKSYHKRLLSRCLCAWHNSTQQLHASAMSLQKRQLLRKGLHALHLAVQFTQMQKQFLERRQYRRVLVYYFNQWRCAVNARQCHLTTEAPNAVSKSCSVHPGMLAALQQLLGTNIYRFWQKQCKRLQHEDIQSPSLSGLRGKDCFEAQARFLAQDCASQHTLFRNHAENLESCFLHWRTLLHIKRGKRVDIPHLFQLCHTEVQQQTTAVSCQSYGKDNDHNKNEKYEMSLQLDDVHLTHEELYSHGSVRLEQSSQPQFQDDREELHKLQIAKYDLDVGDKGIVEAVECENTLGYFILE
ncbi:uncharacterized protein [Mobula birostris]|uniref:uncharacterized protein n=1 Tax=Mobula birostris TaxID=1983395 RepID=UPI003B27EC97